MDAYPGYVHNNLHAGVQHVTRTAQPCDPADICHNWNLVTTLQVTVCTPTNQLQHCAIANPTGTAARSPTKKNMKT